MQTSLSEDQLRRELSTQLDRALQMAMSEVQGKPDVELFGVEQLVKTFHGNAYVGPYYRGLVQAIVQLARAMILSASLRPCRMPEGVEAGGNVWHSAVTLSRYAEDLQLAAATSAAARKAKGADRAYVDWAAQTYHFVRAEAVQAIARFMHAPGDAPAVCEPVLAYELAFIDMYEQVARHLLGADFEERCMPSCRGLVRDAKGKQ